MYESIKPGQPWLDTDGNRIQAHGGSIISVGETFYWYGENKEKTTGENNIWHWGVRCYSSKDMYNWKNEGIIIPPDTEDETSPLHPASMMDRPHIIYNETTQKYVAWLKIMGEPPYFTVLISDHLLGPYKMINRRVNPCGLNVGDFDLKADDKTKKGYLISQRPHTSIYIVRLNDDYTDVLGEYTEHFPHTAPPDAREAPAYFYRNGLHYMITSGTTGYYSNPSEASAAADWMGPYEIQGNPHLNDTTKTSFNSQITSVFKHPGKKDLYIALADRWRPELPVLAGVKWESGEYSDLIQEKFRRIFDPAAEFVFSPEDAKDMRINSSVSEYVWLPLKFDKDKVYIEWLDEWKIQDYK